MEFISSFFIILSLIVLVYLIYTFKSKSRIHLLIELLFLGVYSLILIIFLFPQILNIFENIFGINSAINFFIYLSIFMLFFIVYYLYNEKEKQRIEITKLVREIAYLKAKK